MSHLTATEVFEIVDGTIANGERTKLVQHLENCARCRQEVDFHKTLQRSAKNAPLAKPRKDFTARVLGQITPAERTSLVSKIVNNLGNIIAMGLVLTAVWYALSTPPASEKGKQPTVFSEVFKMYADYYSKAREFIANENARLIAEPSKDRTAKTDHVVTLTVISVLILVVFDRLVVRRVIKIRA